MTTQIAYDPKDGAHIHLQPGATIAATEAYEVDGRATVTVDLDDDGRAVCIGLLFVDAPGAA